MDKGHYTEIFLEKIKEHMQNIYSCMMILDQEPCHKRSIQEVAFSLHLIKGMAKTMGFFRICQLSEDMEDIFAKASNDQIQLTGRLLDLLRESFSVLRTYTENIRETSLEGAYDYKLLRQELKQAAKGSEVKMLPEKVIKRKYFVPEEDKADFTETEEQVPKEMVSVEAEALEELFGPIGDLVMVKNRLEMFCDSRENVFGKRAFFDQIEYLKQALEKLQESAEKIRLVSLEDITHSFRKRIRVLASRENKRADLYMSGLNIRIDRITADFIKEILWYLIWAAAEYGIDSMAVRRRQGKSARGSIYLNAFLENNNVVIRIHDDGNGTDISHKTEENCSMDFRQACLGIERLGGEISASFSPLKGSEYRIRIPFPRIVLEVFPVKVHGEIYVLDMKHVQCIEDIPKTDILDEEGNKIPLIYVDKRLDIRSKGKEHTNTKVVIVKKGSRTAGLVVDAVLECQDAVIRPLDSFIRKDPLIGGAVILKDGRPALILDIGVWI